MNLRIIGLFLIGAMALASLILFVRFTTLETFTFGVFLQLLTECGIVVMITLMLSNSAPATAPVYTGAATPGAPSYQQPSYQQPTAPSYQQPTYQQPAAPQQTTTDISVKAEQLKQVKELLDTGCITLEEFQQMKDEILNK